MRRVVSRERLLVGRSALVCCTWFQPAAGAPISEIFIDPDEVESGCRR